MQNNQSIGVENEKDAILFEENKKALLVLNGEIKDYKKIKDIVIKENYDFIVCCDGGSNHIYNINKLLYKEIISLDYNNSLENDKKLSDNFIIPDYIVGDLDSIEEKVLNYFKDTETIFKKFNSEKDETDTELGILLCNSLKCKTIDIIGALGGRIDHTISNINILCYMKNLRICGRIIAEKEIIYIIENESINLSLKSGSIISIIPIKNDSLGVTLKGFKYNLDNYDIRFSSPIGISNVAKNENCFIEVKKGSLLIVLNT